MQYCTPSRFGTRSSNDNNIVSIDCGIWLLAPEDKRYGQDIIVPRNGIADAKAGQVVAIELMEPPSMHSQPVGRVTEVLGEIDDPGMEIEIAVRKYEVPHRFSPETLAIPRSVDALIMVLLGGLNALAGPLLGAAAFVGLQDFLSRATEYWRADLGVAILLLVLAFPMGIGGGVQWLLARIRR